MTWRPLRGVPAAERIAVERRRWRTRDVRPQVKYTVAADRSNGGLCGAHRHLACAGDSAWFGVPHSSGTLLNTTTLSPTLTRTSAFLAVTCTSWNVTAFTVARFGSFTAGSLTADHS